MDSYDYHGEDFDTVDDSCDKISAEDGLSSFALAALMDVLTPNQAIETDTTPKIKENTICQAYTDGDNQMIAATLRRLQARDDEKLRQALADATVDDNADADDNNSSYDDNAY